MEEYYIKYAKPLDDISIEEVKSKLLSWQNCTREELESLIFISNGLKNETMNRLNQTSKSNTLTMLDSLKSYCIQVMDNISDFLSLIESNYYNEVNSELYSKIEIIRNDYNKQLLDNQKTVSASDILVDLKEKFYKMKKVLDESKLEANEAMTLKNNIKNNIQKRIKHHKKHSMIPTSIPKLNFTTIRDKDPMNRKMNNGFVYKKMCPENNQLLKEKSRVKCFNNKENVTDYNQNHSQQKRNNQCQCDDNDDDNDNEEIPDLMMNDRPLSYRQQLPIKAQHNKDASSTLTLEIPYKMNKANKKQESSSSQLLQMKTEMLLMHEEIRRLKENQKHHQSVKNTNNDEMLFQLTNQNNQMWNEMGNMRKDIGELFNTIKQLNSKVSDLLEDNHLMRKENNSLQQYITELLQSTTQVYTNNTNTKNNKQYDNNPNPNAQIQSMNYQYDNYNNNGGYDSASELSNQYNPNENEQDLSQEIQ